ncbi:hypothetical protein HAX54_042852 [Datura stramonium]|uniref:Trichome birefringence-like C-terminal domain-containing protein n=1 Tax=Datura stramonium TaxID=4076 RepID=A0ABS8W209_DATST|nr:hypothetical protein [Datura stramonium]
MPRFDGKEFMRRYRGKKIIFDVLSSNTWLWYLRSDSKQPWDYVENNGRILKDMDRIEAFSGRFKIHGLNGLKEILIQKKTKVFFQGASPMHYHGSEWGKPEVKNCFNETRPISGSKYPSGLPISIK